MTVLSTPTVSAFAALAAMFMGLALFVQVFQEMYKFLSSSKARAFTNTLVDVLGPWAEQLRDSALLPDLQVRGPFQFRRLRPRGELLPLRQDQLSAALERTVAPWYRRALAALRLEADLQAGKSGPPTPSWEQFLSELGSTTKGAPGYWQADEIVGFLETWGHKVVSPTAGGRQITVPKQFDARAALAAFRNRFLDHIEQATRSYPQIMENYEHAYRRRNLRQTITVAFVVAFLLKLPFDVLYNRATSLSSEEAVALAERSVALYDRVSADTARQFSDSAFQAVAKETLEALHGGKLDYIIDWTFVRDHLWEAGWLATGRYLFGCLVTALLVSFGAPVWHDLTRALLRLQRGPSDASTSVQEPANA